MLNLGFEALGITDTVVSSFELLETQIQSNEQYLQILDDLHELENVIVGYENVLVLQSVVSKYGSNEALVALVGPSVDLSSEGLFGTVRTFLEGIIKKIVELIKKIKNFIVGLFSNNKQAKKDLEEIDANIAELKKETPTQPSTSEEPKADVPKKETVDAELKPVNLTLPSIELNVPSRVLYFIQHVNENLDKISPFCDRLTEHELKGNTNKQLDRFVERLEGCSRKKPSTYSKVTLNTATDMSLELFKSLDKCKAAVDKIVPELEQFKEQVKAINDKYAKSDNKKSTDKPNEIENNILTTYLRLKIKHVFYYTIQGMTKQAIDNLKKVIDKIMDDHKGN